jgi:hypothetical protein
MDLYNRTLEDFDWSINVDQPRALPITESSVQLYMHADLERLVGAPDALLIPVLRQPRGAILLFMVKRFKPRLFVSQSLPSLWRNRILLQQLNVNHQMQERLQKILLRENGEKPPDEDVIQIEKDLRRYLQEQRWEEVQRLLNTLSEGTLHFQSSRMTEDGRCGILPSMLRLTSA